MSLALLVTVHGDSHGDDGSQPSGRPSGPGGPTLPRPSGEGGGPPSLISPPPQNMTGGPPGGKNASDCPPRTGREWVCMVSNAMARAKSSSSYVACSSKYIFLLFTVFNAFM